MAWFPFSKVSLYVTLLSTVLGHGRFENFCLRVVGSCFATRFAPFPTPPEILMFLLVLNSVTSRTQWILQPRPRDVRDECVCMQVSLATHFATFPIPPAWFRISV